MTFSLPTIQKYSIAIVMAVALCFGIFTSMQTAHAQYAQSSYNSGPTENISELEKLVAILLAQIAQLEAQSLEDNFYTEIIEGIKIGVFPARYLKKQYSGGWYG